MSLVDLVKQIPDALHAGQSLENPAIWHNVANLSAAFAVLINVTLEAAKAFGYDLHVESSTADGLAKGLAAILIGVTGVLHTASSPHAGFKANEPDEHTKDVK